MCRIRTTKHVIRNEIKAKRKKKEIESEKDGSSIPNRSFAIFDIQFLTMFALTMSTISTHDIFPDFATSSVCVCVCACASDTVLDGSMHRIHFQFTFGQHSSSTTFPCFYKM